MSGITNEERKVARAQKLYNEGVDQYLKIIEDLNEKIPDIYDTIHGVAMGRKGKKYDVTSMQYGALKDQFHLWKSNIQNPEKAIAHLNNELRKKYQRQKKNANATAEQKPKEEQSAAPKIALFSPKASG